MFPETWGRNFTRINLCPFRSLFCLIASILFGSNATAEITLPVKLDYAIVRTALLENLFTGVDESVRVPIDTSNCNFLTMARPRLANDHDNNLSLRLDVELVGGASVGSLCVFPLHWRGQIEVIEEVYLDASPGVIAFRIIDSRILDMTGATSVPDFLWRWLKQYGHPRLETFRIDLSILLTEVDRLVEEVVHNAAPVATPTIYPSRFVTPAATGQGLQINLALVLPELPHADDASAPPPITAAELAAWDERWQVWDAFATWAIKTFAADADETLRDALMESLMTARYQLRDALAGGRYEVDPVRELFVDTWTNLMPLIAAAEQQQDSGTALRYVAFVSAGDALQALDAAGAQLGFQFNRATLLQLARTLVPTLDPQVLDYGLEPDEELRKLLGLPPTPADLPQDPPQSWLDWWLPAAFAATTDAESTSDLDRWVPQRAELGRYLAAVEALFGTVIGAESKRSKVPQSMHTIYANLFRATAWQESCWRQYVESKGKIMPIRSSAGSIGIMQINQHVWRGIYDVAALGNDVAYNAQAGSEILVHYLVDYAIRKKEHKLTGSDDNLARAAYAVYNGGPSHLRRYRTPETKKSLRAIDDSFWRKYQAMKARGPSVVRQCYSE
ncbi:MAG: lytic transglycosylase domain-containing protein [Proteobacteria bacterium]|nr:lytic transglycosylase domain-containing protein [Pseudomonadota bacterium]